MAVSSVSAPADVGSDAMTMMATTMVSSSVLLDMINDEHLGRQEYVVFDNECSPTFTYQVDGPEVTYLGRGDLHNPKYDDMKIESPLFDLVGIVTDESLYSGVNIDKEFCPWTITVYPSQEKENYFRSSDPLHFALIVAGIFVFTSEVFLCYDRMVEMRQRLVMSQAADSSDLVASLFPKAVRERLYEEAKDKREKEKARSRKRKVKRNKGAFDAGAEESRFMEMMSGGEFGDIKTTKPIADLCKCG